MITAVIASTFRVVQKRPPVNGAQVLLIPNSEDQSVTRKGMLLASLSLLVFNLAGRAVKRDPGRTR